MSNNKKNIALAVLGVVLLGMTIAYAALQTNLSIGGSVTSPAVSWDVHFANFARGTVTGSAQGPTASDLSSYVTGTSISHLEITLPQPGDAITYTWNIENTGTIAAKLNSYSAGWTCDNGMDCSNITYDLTCDNDGTTLNSVLAANSGTSSCTLTVSRAAANVTGASQTYSDTTASGTINATWQYVQQ